MLPWEAGSPGPSTALWPWTGWVVFTAHCSNPLGLNFPCYKMEIIIYSLSTSPHPILKSSLGYSFFLGSVCCSLVSLCFIRGVSAKNSEGERGNYLASPHGHVPFLRALHPLFLCLKCFPLNTFRAPSPPQSPCPWGLPCLAYLKLETSPAPHLLFPLLPSLALRIIRHTINLTYLSSY